MSRVGLGRHGQLDDSAGDPLDGLVNLFDVGIVLAVVVVSNIAAIVPARRARRFAPADLLKGE